MLEVTCYKCELLMRLNEGAIAASLKWEILVAGVEDCHY